MTENEKYLDYLKMLRRPFQKLCRLRFLQPDGSTAFMLDNRTGGTHSGALIADGTISFNWQNGRRTSATVTISNLDGAFDYNFNSVWFGQEIALDEGLILSDGETEFYIQQGVFLIEEPEERVEPGQRTVTYHLVDKAAALDGTLGGNLEGTYQVDAGTNIFQPIAALLAEDRGNGYPVDRINPVFTNYYNGKTQALPDGSTANLTDAPYTLTVDAGQAKWDVIEGLAAMVNGWVGYDETGALRLDPSQDDILDSDKPVDWAFSTEEAELLGLTYRVKNTEVYNDYIVVGEQLSDYSQPNGRAQIFDSRSPVSIDAIGRKTIRVSKAGFGTDTQCQDYADFMVKRSSVLQRAVTISCAQVLHIRGNQLVTVVRTDKNGSPTERHLVQGFSRPLAGTGAMTISATSTQDFSIASVYSKSDFSFSSDSTFTLATSNGQKTWNGTLEYSTDKVTWAEWDGTTTLSAGQYREVYAIFLRGTANSYLTSFEDIPGITSTYPWAITGTSVSCSGNIENLLDYNTVANGLHPNLGNYAFAEMFSGCTALIAPPELPSPVLARYCYYKMFYGCTALTRAPDLPAMNTALDCYDSMFYGCVSITKPPKIYATKMAQQSCEYMFAGCTALTEAPELPATVLAYSCYAEMFYGCTALVRATPLPAATVAGHCYTGMFEGCTALETLPMLPAVGRMAEWCYKGMFDGCAKIKVSATQTGAYQTPWRIPAQGTGEAGSYYADDWNLNTFRGTGGTFTGSPQINTTYYTSNEVV